MCVVDQCRTFKLPTFLPGGSAECSPHAHFTCDNPDTTYHDLCGYWLFSAPDHYVNEEWFGLNSPVPCAVQGPAGGYHLDTLTLRPVYFAMQHLWRKSKATTTTAAATCEELKPCYSCLLKYLPKQLDNGACDHVCLVATVKSAPSSSLPTPPWRT